MGYENICIWCGKLFHQSAQKKYCSKECCLSMQAYRAEVRRKGIVLTVGVAAERHKEELKKQKEAERRLLIEKQLVPVHYTSNGVRWEWKAVR